MECLRLVSGKLLLHDHLLGYTLFKHKYSLAFKYATFILDACDDMFVYACCVCVDQVFSNVYFYYEFAHKI